MIVGARAPRPLPNHIPVILEWTVHSYFIGKYRDSEIAPTD